jgi:hypothetical protein
VVSGRLQQEGWTLISSQGDNQIDPSIWFLGDSGPEWIVVRSMRFRR